MLDECQQVPGRPAGPAPTDSCATFLSETQALTQAPERQSCRGRAICMPFAMHQDTAFWNVLSGSPARADV